MKKIFNYILAFMLTATALMPIKLMPVNAEYEEGWFDESEPIPEEFVYSFAMVGDTQSLSEYNKDHMHTLYQWIIDNKDEKNTQFVFGLGDITESDQDWEWENDKAAISKLDGVIPHSLIRGNHDTSAKFYKTFGYEEYTNQFLGFYKENNINSSYRTLTVGKVNFLLLTLDYGADDEELVWAGNIIEKYPNHKVIISTHAYLNSDDSLLSKSDSTAPSLDNDDDKLIVPDKKFNAGEEIWDKLVANYGNIVLVLSGHIGTDEVCVLTSQGVHGNYVTQMLIDPQTMDKTLRAEEGCGMVCTAYFNEDFTKMRVEYYSTVKQKYYKESNQKEIDISGWGKQAHNLTTYKNDYFHWQECDCGRKMVENLEEHSFKYPCSGKCSGCDLTRDTIHDFTAIGYDETGHFNICAGCSEKDISSTRAHIYDAACDNSCNQCGYVRTVNHTVGSVVYQNVDSHWQECDVCHQEIEKTTHIYDNSCDAECNTCKYVRYIYHDYSILVKDGNKYWKECSICGESKEITFSTNNQKGTLIIVLSICGAVLIAGAAIVLFLKLKSKKA